MNDLKLMYNKDFYINNILSILIDENKTMNNNLFREYHEISAIDSELIFIEKNIRQEYL